MNIKYTIQKRVSYLMGGGLLIIAINNLFTHVIEENVDFFSAIITPYVWILFLFAILGLLTGIKDNAFLRACQVSLFFIMAVIGIYLQQEELNMIEVYFFICVFILSIQYGYLRKYFVLKFISLFCLFTCTRFFLSFFLPNDKLQSAIGSILITILIINIIWISFSEEIKDHIAQARELQQRINQNAIFVSFGKNVIGVTHNLKNKIMAIQSYNELVQESSDPEIQKYGKLQKDVINSTNELINSLNLAVKARHDEEMKVLAMHEYIKSVVDVFNANSQFHRDVFVTLNLIEDDFILISPSIASQIIENLLRNSWEAKKENSIVNINLITERIGDQIKFTIRDDGVGIPFCSNCVKKKCQDCKNFRIGHSTKIEGTGIGLVYIRNELQKIKGRMQISSKENVGTLINILFPVEEHAVEFLVD